MPQDNASNPEKGNSVIAQPQYMSPPTGGDYIIYMATIADDIVAWGDAVLERDRQLRAFWPTEPLLASSLYSTVSRYASFGWKLEGPSKTVAAVEKVMHGSEFGEGWVSFMMKTLIDLFTQDNGAFVEIVRSDDAPNAPVLSFNHLDSNRCVRTGLRQTPVLYYDERSNGHLLKWYQVIPLAEMPSPIERMRGVQYCAVTRMLRAAQILRDISIYKREKIGGRFNRAIHLISGVQKQTVDDALKQQAASSNSTGYTHYLQPLIIAALDPTAKVSKETIELASLPDHFDEETTMKWYVTQMAMAFGQDHQDFAPLPGGNLGSSQQSQVLNMKSRAKGPKLFTTMVEHLFDWHGLLPSTVVFTYGDPDPAEDMQNAQLKQIRAQTRTVMVTSGQISPEVARKMAVDDGDLKEEYLEELAAYDEQKKAEQQQQAELAHQNALELQTSKAEAKQSTSGGAPYGNQNHGGTAVKPANDVKAGQVK